ncbi:MAG: radical SAM protein [Desulfosudis oleivorans]|nr:radical SAM protein [Desulfosudis oleivorans]
MSERTSNNIYFHLEGICNRRQLDIEKASVFLKKNGYKIVENPDDAEKLFYWVCAFNTFREDEGLKKLEELIPAFEEIYVLEGLPAVVSDKVAKLGINQNNIIPFEEMEQFYKLFARKIKFEEIDEVNSYYDRKYKKFSIQVAHGCNDNCAYCGDKKVVGNLKSKPLHKILNELNNALNSGIKQIELLGDDVGAYGIDCDSSIIDLLESITSINQEFLITMQEVNIKYLINNSAQFEEILKRNKIKHMMIAFQSGNSRILEAMQRGYTKQDIINLILILQKYGVTYNFHTIVGFPSETFEEFKDTLSILESYNFSSCTLFKFQDRIYTPAHQLENKITREEIENRIEYAMEKLKDKYSFVVLPDKLQIKHK